LQNYEAIGENSVKTATEGLRFVSIDIETALVVVFADESFANAENYRSQIGCLLLFVLNVGV
jgi:hypothetical protein